MQCSVGGWNQVGGREGEEMGGWSPKPDDELLKYEIPHEERV